MRRRPELMVVGASLLIAVLVLALPASAQSASDVGTTTTPPPTTSTTTGITLLPTTSAPVTTTTVHSTTLRTTSTSLRATTTSTTVATVPAITLPANTTTTELLEPPGPVGLPTTTSLAPGTRKSDGGISVGTIVWLAIAGLLLLALVLAVFTWRFIRGTRPLAAPGAAPEGAATVHQHG